MLTALTNASGSARVLTCVVIATACTVLYQTHAIASIPITPSVVVSQRMYGFPPHPPETYSFRPRRAQKGSVPTSQSVARFPQEEMGGVLSSRGSLHHLLLHYRCLVLLLPLLPGFLLLRLPLQTPLLLLLLLVILIRTVSQRHFLGCLNRKAFGTLNNSGWRVAKYLTDVFACDDIHATNRCSARSIKSKISKQTLHQALAVCRTVRHNTCGAGRAWSVSTLHVGPDQPDIRPHPNPIPNHNPNPNPLGGSRSAGAVTRFRLVFGCRLSKKTL